MRDSDIHKIFKQFCGLHGLRTASFRNCVRLSDERMMTYDSLVKQTITAEWYVKTYSKYDVAWWKIQENH